MSDQTDITMLDRKGRRMTHALIDDRSHSKASDHQDLELPDYAPMLTAYHRAYALELQAIIDDLPLHPGARILDMACGDGTYAPWIARHIGDPGMVVGADMSLDYLRFAQRHVRANPLPERSCWSLADVDRLPFKDDCFDIVWCAQSLYDFPDALRALREIRRVVRRGGLVIVFENDRLHHLLLPWPARFELALRQAEMQSLTRETRHPEKFYVGRRLRFLFRLAGLQACHKRTYATNRQAPLETDEKAFLQAYLQRLHQRVAGYLEPAMRRQLEAYLHSSSSRSLLNHPDITVTCVDHVIWGIK
jgi:ubiquinone/menaquinone biosynthesis C-methylase UbiE